MPVRRTGDVLNGRPAIQQYTVSFDANKSEFIPAKVQLHLIDAENNIGPGVLREEYELESVTPDERPPSFFTLTEFGIPEPGETGVRVPLYRQPWAWAGAAAAVVLAAAAAVAARRRLRAA
jgi:hypothetical protein